MIEISDEYMIATIDGQIVATAHWSWHAAADGKGLWIISTHSVDYGRQWSGQGRC